MQDLESFISTIDDFMDLKASKQIDYFVYYGIVKCNQSYTNKNEIEECFDHLDLPKYSNTSSYLSQQSKGKNKKFIKDDSQYKIVRKYKQELKESISDVSLPERVQSDFLPVDLFDDTRGYVKKLANQVLASYNYGIHDGCSVLLRKLVELLIIECFERMFGRIVEVI